MHARSHTCAPGGSGFPLIGRSQRQPWIVPAMCSGGVRGGLRRELSTRCLSLFPHKRKNLLTGKWLGVFDLFGGTCLRRTQRKVIGRDVRLMCCLRLFFFFFCLSQEMLTESERRRERRESKLSGFAEFSQLFSPQKTKSPHCRHSLLENELFALPAHRSETCWDCYCRLKLTRWINKRLPREKKNQNKRTD